MSVRNFADVSEISPFSSAATSQDVTLAARQILEVQPLDPSSYYALGLAAEKTGDERQARRLIRHSLALDPRQRVSRLWLLTDSVKLGRWSEAARQARIIVVLSPQSLSAVSTILASGAGDPRARHDISLLLKGDPLLLATASQAARTGLPADALIELLAPTNLKTLPNGVTAAQTLLSNSLMREGRFQEARTIWYKLAGRNPQNLVFDGRFRGLTGSPPFGWTFNTGAELETSLDSGTGPGARSALAVTSFGGLSAVAALQTLVLTPGRYEFEFAAASEHEDVSNRSFVWQLSCSSGTFIAEVAIDNVRSVWQRARQLVVIPPGCPTQILQLAKLRTSAGERSVRVTDVTLTPAHSR